MLHRTIRNDDFQHNTVMQCCNHSKQCHCCNAVLSVKSSLPIVSCHITLMTCMIDFHCRPREVAFHTIPDSFLCRHEKRSSICLVPRLSLLMKMCAQRKAGRRQRARLPSVPFPWSLAVHHQSLVSHSPLPCEKRSAWGGGWSNIVWTQPKEVQQLTFWARVPYN